MEMMEVNKVGDYRFTEGSSNSVQFDIINCMDKIWAFTGPLRPDAF